MVQTIGLITTTATFAFQPYLIFSTKTKK